MSRRDRFGLQIVRNLLTAIEPNVHHRLPLEPPVQGTKRSTAFTGNALLNFIDHLSYMFV